MFIPRAERPSCRSNQVSNFHAKESVGTVPRRKQIWLPVPRNKHHRGERRNPHFRFGRIFNFSSTSANHRELGDHLRRNYSAFRGALASLGKVTFLSRPSSHSRQMNYTSDKKRKKSPEPVQKCINLGTPINIAAGPLRFRPELDTDPRGNRDRSHRDSELQIDLIRLWRQMTATPGLLGSYPTRKTKVIPPRKHRPVVLWPVAMNTAVTVPVGISDPRYCDRRSFSSLCFFVSGGYTYDTGEGVGKLTEQTGSTCQDDRAISFPLTSASSGERPEGHLARGWPHSFLCPSGSRR